MGSEVRAYSAKEESNLTEEMDFELIIGNLGPWDTPVQIGRYYSQLGVIAVDGWDGEWEESYMADILSHEFIHHLLHTRFDDVDGGLLDNLRPRLTEEQVQEIGEKGLLEVYQYMSPVAQFAIECSILNGDEDTEGNGVI
jgi:hypothetical protein